MIHNTTSKTFGMFFKLFNNKIRSSLACQFATSNIVKSKLQRKLQRTSNLYLTLEKKESR